MQIMRNSVIIVFFVTLIAFCGVFLLQKNQEDNTIPEITIENDFIEVSCNASDEELLKGVTATDEKDGDLTGDIIVESISRFVTAITMLLMPKERWAIQTI